MACLDNNRQLSIIAMVHVSNWSKQWHCFEFLKLFFHSVFLCFLQETERPMHLSYRETNYKKRVEQVVCSIAVSFNIFSQPNFLTKQLKNFLSDKQILRFKTFLLNLLIFKKNIIKDVQYNTHIYMPLETRIILPVFKHVFDYLVKLPCLSYLSF